VSRILQSAVKAAVEVGSMGMDIPLLPSGPLYRSDCKSQKGRGVIADRGAASVQQRDGKRDEEE
jgi:hypothetical protein